MDMFFRLFFLGFFFFLPLSSFAQLEIMEVSFIGTNEWIIVENIWESTFSWDVSLTGLKSSLFTISLDDISPWDQFIIWDKEFWTSLKAYRNSWISLIDTKEVNLSLSWESSSSHFFASIDQVKNAKENWKTLFYSQNKRENTRSIPPQILITEVFISEDKKNDFITLEFISNYTWYLHITWAWPGIKEINFRVDQNAWDTLTLWKTFLWDWYHYYKEWLSLIGSKKLILHRQGGQVMDKIMYTSLWAGVLKDYENLIKSSWFRLFTYNEDTTTSINENSKEATWDEVALNSIETCDTNIDTRDYKTYQLTTSSSLWDAKCIRKHNSHIYSWCSIRLSLHNSWVEDILLQKHLWNNLICQSNIQLYLPSNKSTPNTHSSKENTTTSLSLISYRSFPHWWTVFLQNKWTSTYHKNTLYLIHQKQKEPITIDIPPWETSSFPFPHISWGEFCIHIATTSEIILDTRCTWNIVESDSEPYLEDIIPSKSSLKGW